MRVILVLRLLGMAGLLAFVAMTTWRRHDRELHAASRSTPALGAASVRTGSDMARFLETSLEDPVYRASDEWARRADTLVRRWYDDPHRKDRTP